MPRPGTRADRAPYTPPVAEPLKTFFDAALVRRLGREVRAAWPAFPAQAFAREAGRGLAPLGLLDRARHIARALQRHLPADAEQALDVLVASLPPPLPPPDEGAPSAGLAPFAYLPHVLFTAEHGLGCFEAAMRAQHALTQRFTAEFSLRAFLTHHPAATLARLADWTRDPSPHVRRAVSEGTRPRLPWAPRLPAFQADPTPVLALLERLRDDPSPYVRRSVANNLNDIGKDHPARLVATCRAWARGASPERRALIAHALRSAVKRGDPAALAVLGYDAARRPVLRGVEAAPADPRIGSRVTLTVHLANPEPAPLPVVADLAVHFVKARGPARPKVFKLRALTLAPGEEARLRATISLRQHTTRTHHPGRHRVEVLLNGRPEPGTSFLLRP